MSTTGQVAVLNPRGAVTRQRGLAGSPRALTRLATFGTLALYGILKWATLVTGHPLGRLLSLLLVAVLLAGGRPVLARRSRALATVATAVALIAIFPIAGVPLAWLWHVRIAVTANAIGEGLSALPQVLVPYSGANQWVDLVMTLGAAVLLFDAALLLAFAPETMQTVRRAGAALPLVALVAVPTTLVRPALPYVDGAILFVLLVAFMWGEQIGRRRLGGAFGLGAIAVVAAMVLAPSLERHKPWFNIRALAGSLTPRYIDGFDWSQGYGRIDWPRAGRVVLEIKAARPEYWKAQNLDAFNGVGWQEGVIQGQTAAPAPRSIARWSQTIQVVVRSMQTADVVGAGTSQEPIDVPESLNQGVSPGTWRTAVALRPGDAYQVTIYAPHPSAAQLATAGADYAAVPDGYRTVELAPASGTPSPDENYLPEQVPNGHKKSKGYQAQLVFPPFHAGAPIAVYGGPKGIGALSLLGGSDVVGHHSLLDAYRVAAGLAAGASTPYRFALAVESYLRRGFAYNENPPSSPYPLVSFLFSGHRGYCQQFAGAMALLLRMGGLPARVAVGFTPGRLDSAIGRWLVTDYDAHAWVEAWFPGYGWVTFDPTPSADPALSRQPPTPVTSGTNISATGAGLSAAKTVRGVNVGRRRLPHGAIELARRGSGLGSDVPWIVGPIALLVISLLVIATKPLRSVEAMVSELELALRRMGRPLPGGATLTWLERRVDASPEAAAYVRALRRSRFRGPESLPTAGHRRALRRQLRRGLGPFAVLRSIWALPPRWQTPGR